MAIRSAAKAVIMRDGKVLLNRCYGRTVGEYYALPGGGQLQHESLPEAIRRECLEETGYTVAIDRFLALCEEIITDEAVRQRHPDYTHKVYHVFLCHIACDTKAQPSERDANQVGCEWVAIEDVAALRLFPRPLAANLARLIRDNETAWFETDYS